VKPPVIGSAIDDIESRFVFVYKSHQLSVILILVYRFFALQAKKRYTGKIKYHV